MTKMDIASFEKNLVKTIEAVIEKNDIVCVSSDCGNVVVLPESEYSALVETIYLKSAPGVYRELMDAKKSDPAEYVDYDPNRSF